MNAPLLCQVFVYWVRDFKFWLLGYFLIFFNCSKFQKDWKIWYYTFHKVPPFDVFFGPLQKNGVTTCFTKGLEISRTEAGLILQNRLFWILYILFRVPFNLPELNFLVGFYSFHMRKVDKYTYVCQPNLPNLDFDRLWLACFLSNPCQCKKCCQTWKLEINLAAFCFCHWAYNGAAISHLCLLDPIELCFCCIILIVIIAYIMDQFQFLIDYIIRIQSCAK